MDKELIEFYRDKTFLITGSSGLIGTNVVSMLLDFNKRYACNIKIIAHVLNEDEIENNKVLKNNKELITFVICDIRDFQYNGNFDYVIHTVGVTGGSKQHIDNPLRTIFVSIDGTRKMLDVCSEKKCSGFIFLSTLEIYGNTGFSSSSISEHDGGFLDPASVRSSYSESKRICETLCVSYHKEYGLPTYIARLTASFGKYVSIKDKRVFAQFAHSIINNSNIVLKSNGLTVRNYCDAEDTARAFLYIMKNGTAGCAYNIANPSTEITIKDLALKFISLFPNKKTKLIFELDDVSKYGYNAEMRNVLNADCLLNLGWKPKYTLEDSIIRLVESLEEDLVANEKV